MDMCLPPGLAGLDRPIHPPHGLPAFSYSFQPIVDVIARKVFSHEALIRGPANEAAFQILGRVPAHSRHQFDQESRVAAIALAAGLGLDCHLNLNFLPQGLDLSATSITSMLEAASLHRLPVERLILEVTEGEVIADHLHFAACLNEYRRIGLKLAIDDFGAGYAGLNLLADFQPDQVKIDMNLVRGIETHGPRQAIVRAIAQVCGELGIDVIAEGVETFEEYRWLADQGIRLFQGYLFAKPAFEAFAEVRYPRPAEAPTGKRSGC